MRIVFMGTPQFAIPSLKALIDSRHSVVGVVCQPDKKQGRNMVLTSPPTKDLAISHNIRVLQPDSAKHESFLNELLTLDAEIFVTSAYGKILPQRVLEIPQYGCVNVHASLLPKYRGAAPIQWSIINGESETGITTMLTDVGMDTGPILLKEKLDLDDTITASELHDKLMFLGPKVLLKTLEQIEAGTIVPIPQNDSEATSAPMLKKENGKIFWADSARKIHNLVRGINPWPGAYSTIKDMPVKICATFLSEKIIDHDEVTNSGEIVGISKDGITVKCGLGEVVITEIQAASGKKMDAQSFANGQRLVTGDRYE